VTLREAELDQMKNHNFINGFTGYAPLNAILGCSDMLHESSNNSPRQRNTAARILKAMTMLALVNNLLTNRKSRLQDDGSYRTFELQS
jgi:hypothetical protein